MSESPPRIFRHYKNKLYRYRGVAKHSETLEDLVVYETLYENPLGKLWVRPKDMYFSRTDDGSRLRFAPVEIEYADVRFMGLEEIERLEPLIQEALGRVDGVKLRSVLQHRGSIHLWTASLDGEWVGFKAGYSVSDTTFYSWLGGVKPGLRGWGIAAELMRRQHEWCRQQGFRQVRTKTQNKWREMLILNLKFGFDVVGSYVNSRSETKLMLEKKL